LKKIEAITMLQSTSFEFIGPILVSLFFAILFLQSSFDKLLNRNGNIEYLTEVFHESIFKNRVGILFILITCLELLSGLTCFLGVFQSLYGNLLFARIGIVLSSASLLCLFLGLRIAKDYAGAADLTAYFAVALVGFLILL